MREVRVMRLVCVCVCVCIERERERERERENLSSFETLVSIQKLFRFSYRFM